MTTTAAAVPIHREPKAHASPQPYAYPPEREFRGA